MKGSFIMIDLSFFDARHSWAAAIIAGVQQRPDVLRAQEWFDSMSWLQQSQSPR
jgi:hypothetical protein